MRLLHLSDTHLGAELRVRGAPQHWSRAADHLAAFETALAPALAEDVDMVIHTGDLFDRSHPPHDAIASAVVLLHKVARRVPVVIMPGNHDRRGLLDHLVECAGLHICDAPGRLVIKDVALGVVPYLPSAEAWGFAASEATGPGVDLLLAHQSFHGSRVGNFWFRAGYLDETIGSSAIPKGCRYVGTGHIHPRQALRLGETTVVHTGSTERTSFTERDEIKGYTLWDFDAAVQWRFVDLPARPMAWVTRHEQIEQLEPGMLTGLVRDMRTVEIEAAALARGVWLSGRPSDARAPYPRPAGRQARIFGAD